MADCFIIFIAVGAGYLMSLCSFLLGIKVMHSMVSGNKKLFFSPPDPVGDVFNVETPDDMALFPEDVVNEAEEHILAKTNKFLEKFNAPGGDK